MKQDSYPRFLKCDLYKESVMAEMEGKPLPYSEKLDKKVRLILTSLHNTPVTMVPTATCNLGSFYASSKRLNLGLKKTFVLIKLF